MTKTGPLLEAREAGPPLVLLATTDRLGGARICDILRGQGCQVKWVESIIDAVAELHGVEYDLAFVAHAFPPRTGTDVVRVARELSPQMEVIVILDDGKLEAPIDCVRHGAYDFLRQPLAEEELLDVLARAIGRREERTSTAMFRASHAILTGTTSEQLPQMMVDLAAELLEADGVSLFQESAGGALALAHAKGFEHEEDAAELVALAARVTEHGASAVPILLPDDTVGGNDVLASSRLRSVIVCPILINGRIAGILAAERSRDPRPFRRADAERMGVLASQLRLAFDNARLFAKTVGTERLAAIGELAAGVAHEINNPLTFVLNNCLSAIEEVGALAVDTGDILPMLRDVREGAERIREIARDLRTLSRGNTEPEVFDLGEAIASAMRIAGPSLRATADVVADLAKDMRVLGKPGRACQVFVNLLVNAAQACGKRTPRLRVELALVRREGRIVATVRDDGPGILPEHLPRIFDAFFTTKSSDSGTGLGLSITRAIVEDHGGTIAVTSTVGIGTTFTIDLPASSAARCTSSRQSAA